MKNQLSAKASDRRPSGRPNQGKTETIRQRKFDVYLPTAELLQAWRDTAKDNNMPLSRYIMEVVEQHRMGVRPTQCHRSRRWTRQAVWRGNWRC